MEDLAIEGRKAGAQPMLVISSERLIRRSYDEVPAKYDAQEPKVDLAVAKLFDAQIAIDFGETEGLLAGVPPERLAARAKAGAPVNEVFLKHNVHFVNLGNGLYPTATLAKRLGVTQAGSATGCGRAVAVPPERIQAAGEQLRTAFASGGPVQLTHPNGTNLTFDVTGRTPTISAGALTPGQAEQGGAALLTWLPAGEFQIAAVPGSAEGKIVIDRALWSGKVIRGLTLVFSQGKLTSMTAALAVTGAVVYAQGRAVIFADSRTASFKAMMPGVSSALIWGDTVKGPYAGFTKFVPGFDAGVHSHTNDVLLVVVNGAYLYKDDAGEKRVGAGDFLRIPGGHKHWSGGDAKEGALFYQETFGKFDLIPAK